MGAWAERIRYGVIDDARERSGRERRRAIAAFLVLLLIAAVVSFVLAASGGSTGPTRVVFADGRFSAAGMAMSIRLTVSPKPGGATASFQYNGSHTLDNNVPARGPRVLVRWDTSPRDTATPGRIMAAIVGPGVTAVRAGDYGTFDAHHVSGLPPGYRAVVFYYPGFPALASVHARTRQGLDPLIRKLELLQRRVPLSPLNASGRATASPNTYN